MPLVWVALCAWGCGGGGSAQSPPTVVVTAPALDAVVPLVGGLVSVTYTDDDPDGAATTDLFADRDGDLATVADQVAIALGRPLVSGAAQTVVWNPAGTQPGAYHVVARTQDDTSTVVASAPGVVTLDAPPTLTLLQPAAASEVSRSGLLGVEYTAGDPEGAVLTAFSLDADGDPGTAGDAHAVDVPPSVQPGPRAPTVLAGVPEGTYSVLGSASDGVNPLVRAAATGMVTVSNLAWARGAVGSGYDHGNAVVLCPDGSVAVAGLIQGSTTFGAGEANQTILSSLGSDDVFVARYEANGSLRWVRRAGGTSYEEGVGVTALAGGAVVICGQMSGSSTFGPGEPNETTLVSAGSGDVFLARYEADGSLGWATRAGGTGVDHADGVAALPDGSVYVTGLFSGAATFGGGEPGEATITASGLEDTFLAHYAADGTLGWVRRSGGVSSDSGRGVAALPSGDVLVCGFFAATGTFGSGEANETVLTAPGGTDAFLARYAADGTLAWARRAGGGGSDAGRGVVALPDGSSRVAGYFGGSATFGPGEPGETILAGFGSFDVFVAAFDAQGGFVWARSAGGSTLDEGHGIALLPDDSVVVTGYVRSEVTFGLGEANETALTAHSLGSPFCARYGPDGALQWVRIPSTGVGDGNGVAAFPDGSSLVVGKFGGSLTFGAGEPHESVVTGAGLDDIFLARFNADGGF